MDGQKIQVVAAADPETSQTHTTAHFVGANYNDNCDITLK